LPYLPFLQPLILQDFTPSREQRLAPVNQRVTSPDQEGAYVWRLSALVHCNIGAASNMVDFSNNVIQHHSVKQILGLLVYMGTALSQQENTVPLELMLGASFLSLKN